MHLNIGNSSIDEQNYMPWCVPTPGSVCCVPIGRCFCRKKTSKCGDTKECEKVMTFSQETEKGCGQQGRVDLVNHFGEGVGSKRKCLYSQDKSS